MLVIIFCFAFLQAIDYFVIVVLEVLIHEVVVEFAVSMCTPARKINAVRLIVRLMLTVSTIFWKLVLFFGKAIILGLLFGCFLGILMLSSICMTK